VLQNIIILKPILIYSVRDKDTIKFQIVTYLPLAKRGFKVIFPLEGIVNALLLQVKNRGSA
jgi:hypothetical protein